MKVPDLSKSRPKGWFITLAVLTAVLAPIAVYVWTFGTELSHTHQRWSEMGSAMSGIYAPLLAILTLAVLAAQVHLQSSMNRHTFDQSFVQNARDDVHFYLNQLAAEMTRKFNDGSEIKTVLVDAFAYANAQCLDQPDVIEVAQELNRRHQRLLALWSAFYSVLAGLRTHNFYPYSTAYITTKQKAIAMLSYEGCAALDNFVWCVSERRLNYGFEFSGAELPQPE